MLNKRVLMANFKLTYRRTLNRLIYFFPSSENLLKSNKILFVFAPFFLVYLFILYKASQTLLTGVPEHILTLGTNFIILFFVLNILKSSTDIIHRYVYPEDFLLLHTLKTDPKKILLSRFFTTIFLNILFKLTVVLFPILFFINFSTHDRIYLLLSFPSLLIFIVGLTSLYSSLTYIVYSKFLHNILNSRSKSLLSLIGIACLSAISTTFLGWIGLNYFYQNDLLEAIGNFIHLFKLDTILTTNWLPTNWFLLSTSDVHLFFICSIGYIALGCLFVFITFHLILKVLIIKEAVPNNLLPKLKPIKLPFFSFLQKALPRQNIAILKKDLTALLRANFTIKKRLVLSINMIAIELGVLIGLSLNQMWFDFSDIFVIYPILFAVTYNTSLLGEGILGVTSADAERENLYVYKSPGASIFKLIAGKSLLHLSVILILMNTLYLFILLLFNLDIMTKFILFIMINSISLIIGAGQIIGTFLYPRLDWENFEDIGSSVKASFFEHTILGVLLAFYLQLYGITGVLVTFDIINRGIFFLIIVTGTILFVIGIGFFYYFWIKRIGTKNWEMKT
ncbi:hypothetical protein VSK91_08000 [Bacillus swezeyi]|uniref:hypothetical protein n=1 Tax=Bacillus swezeyi TaxID=1925020 RepID=UPI0039C6B5B1